MRNPANARPSAKGRPRIVNRDLFATPFSSRKTGRISCCEDETLSRVKFELANQVGVSDRNDIVLDSINAFYK